MQHKYINDLNISSNETCVFNTTEIDEDRKERFEKQREEYGFDERETWSLDWTLAGWLYSHLKMYEEKGGSIVNLEYHKFEIPVLKEIPENDLKYIENSRYPEKYYEEVYEEHTQLEAIHIMEEYLKFFLEYNFDCSEKEMQAYEKAKCAYNIFAIVHAAMWW